MNTQGRPLSRALWIGLWGGLCLLAGCSLMPERLAPGTERAIVIERLGAPTARHVQPGGERLQYSRQPAGQQVYNIDLDGQGRVLRVQQVLDIEWLRQNIRLDAWTREDARRELGRPAWVDAVARFDGEVWNYRFLEMGIDRVAHLHFDPGGVLRRLVFTDERRGEPPELLP